METFDTPRVREAAEQSSSSPSPSLAKGIQAISRLFQWSETKGYRWLRITLCIFLLVFVPKGYSDVMSALSPPSSSSPTSSQLYTVSLDFERALSRQQFRLTDDQTMQICVYVALPESLYPSTNLSQSATTPTPSVPIASSPSASPSR